MKAQQPIYLDGHATTPLAPEAAEAMAPWWSARAANAHSPHAMGLAAAAAVERARRNISALAGVDPQEIFFTSGATEANNIALIGTALAAISRGDSRRRIAVSAIEHKSVLEAARSLESLGFQLDILPVSEDGLVDLQGLDAGLNPETLIVSVMAANNEVGTIQPLKPVIERARKVGALVHVDAAQAFGKIALDLSDVDFASMSAHKLYGPVGVGALFVSAAAAFRPQSLMHGGGQEHGLRPGTLPVPLIVGFGTAAELAGLQMGGDDLHGRGLAQRFLEALRARQVRFNLNAPTAPKLPGSVSIQLPEADAASLIDALAESICISDGSACSAGQITASHVLKAMRISDAGCTSTIRLLFGRYSTEADADAAAIEISHTIATATPSCWTGPPAAA